MAEKWVLLQAAQIDKTQWDLCVNSQAHGLIYAQTSCLDTMSAQWHGLVMDDYTAVLPLPWKKKWGIRYLYTPPFLQQLGIIGRYKASSLPIIQKRIFQFCLYGDMQLNYANQLAAASIQANKKTNLIISLNQPLESIRIKYKQDTKENIRKAENNSLQYSEENTLAAIQLYQQQYADRMPHINSQSFSDFIQLCNLLSKTGQCITRKITDPNGHILASAVLLKDSKRLYNLMNSTLPEGRKKWANHLLIDRIIEEFAGTQLLLDLEGSELPGVQQFYLSFGAVEQPYFAFHFNRLPWPLNLLKR